MYLEQQPDKIKNLCKRLIARFEEMKGSRTTWESHWQECMEYIIPRKEDVTSESLPGDKKTDLFDSTAISANQLLAGTLHGMLTNPSVRFFDLVSGDPKQLGNEDYNRWLQEVADAMFAVLNNSNFQTEIHEIYIDLGAIGTASLYMGEDEKNVIHFSARPIKEIFIKENNLGLIDIVYRCFKWDARQIVQEFGEEKTPKLIYEMYEKGDTKKFEIIHAVEPSEDLEYDSEIKKHVFPYKSCYILKEECYLLNEGGFKEFPYAVPRWTKTTGEEYGRGPGMDVLSDIKMVNKMMETVIKGAQMTVTPPMMVADDGVVGKVRLTPAGITIIRPFSGNEVPIRPLITDARIDFGYQAVDDVRRRIKAGFYADQLQMSSGPQKTATEVMQFAEQQLRFMGPILGRQHFEFLSPVIKRLFGIMTRKKLISPPPAGIPGFDVRYSSLIARAQRMGEGQNLTRAISVVAPIGQIDPKIFDLLNGDAALRYIFDIYGIPAKIMNDNRTVQESRKAREQAQQKMMKEQQAAQQADIASKTMPGMAQVIQAQQQQ